MPNRRAILRIGIAGALAAIQKTVVSAAPPTRLLLIHGRDQQGKDPTSLKTQWLGALKEGAKKLGRTLPTNVDVAFPFYGDKLDEFAKAFDIPLTDDIKKRGSAVDEDFLSFQADIAEALRTAAGVTDPQIDAEYGTNPKQKGPQNWEWVQAILRAVDKHSGGLNATAIERFTRDVFLYSRRSGVRDAIDNLVASSLTEDPTVVVGHSLGSVVAYSVLRRDPRRLRVPLLVTVGSPLGVRAIRDEFRPLSYPKIPKIPGSWYNAFDPRDVVALYPLDATNFPVTPSIVNADTVKNHTTNRHGIIGYLDDSEVAKRILDALAT